MHSSETRFYVLDFSHLDTPQLRTSESPKAIKIDIWSGKKLML